MLEATDNLLAGQGAADTEPQPPRPDGRPQGDPTPCDCGQAPQHHHHIEGGPAVEVSRPQEAARNEPRPYDPPPRTRTKHPHRR